MLHFSDLGLASPLLEAVAAEGYLTPTPIQAQAIPAVLAGRDLCGIAQTGTGKTAAFALPILQRLTTVAGRPVPKTCRALVLSPTRELASQIADNFRAYGGGMPVSTAVVFGGVSIGRQRDRLAGGVDVLVATPGRLLDLIDSKSLALSSVQILVLDEADRMLDLGFVHALKRIVKLLPRPRQTLLFSATMPRPIATLAEDYLDNPVKVVVAPAATAAQRIDQGVVFIPSERKRDLLATMLRDPALVRVLVFTRTKHGADRVVRHLSASGFAAAAIHGNKSQPQRERALAGFRHGVARVLVATDIAARGIDVDGVSHVINFDLPNVPEDYVHRIGRTARAGAAGIAVAFCSQEERPYLREIEKLTRNSLRPIAVEGPPKNDMPRSSAHSGRELPRHPRQVPVRAKERKKSASPGEGFAAFLHRSPAGKASPGARRPDRRHRAAVRSDGAR